MDSENKNNVIVTNIEDVLHNSMIPFAEDVILNRALPRVEDGLKPVQRRILYAMYDLGLTPDKPYKKSAKVVGECLAKYHPHGDSSVYDAMVRMAQPFNMGRTLVDGQGNYGSVDGDGAAAMRYTEARLNSLALEMLKDLDKDTVDMVNNYDDSLHEPKTLPCRFPNILVNGGMGIAVGLATNIPPHNLGETIDGAVAYLKNPKIRLAEMMQIIKGPDFPTGGQVITGDELVKAYETGKGKIMIRSSYSVEKEPNGKATIIISEIPYQVNKSATIQKIGQLMEEKRDAYVGIQDVVDESDRHGMRIAIKLKKDVNPSKVLTALFKDTNLQISFGINMVMIADGKPKQLGLLEILRYYTEYQKQVVLRRTKFDLNKAKARYEIVCGLIIAVTNIDKVIKIIKASPDTPTARQNLRKEFDLSEAQAQAILDLKLARLTRLEIDALKDELESLKQLIKNLQEIVDSKKRLTEVVIDELNGVKKAYKSPRQSVVLKDFEPIKESGSKKSAESAKEVENYVFGLSGKGLIRKVKVMSFSRSKSDTPSVEESFTLSNKVSSDEVVYAFTNFGNVYRIGLDRVPEAHGATQGGVLFEQLIKTAPKGETPVQFFSFKEGKESGKVIIFTRRGVSKITDFKEFTVMRGDVTVAMKLKDGDEVIAAEIVQKDADLLFVTEKGMCLRCVNTVSEQGKAAGGVAGMDVADGDKVIFAAQVQDDTETEAVIVTSFGTFKRVMVGTIPKTARARKGVKIAELGKAENNECVVYAGVRSQAERCIYTVVDRIGIIYHVEADDIPVEDRTSKGRTVAKIGPCQPLSVYCARR